MVMFEKYFSFRTLPKRLLRLFNNRQPILASKVSLNFRKSLIPSPPTDLGVAIVSHNIQPIFLVFSLLSHQKRVTTDWIRLHRNTGSLKHVIEYEGMGDRTLWSITSFPTEDRNFVDHPRAFYWIRSTIEENMSRFLLPKESGRPRYLPTPPSLWI